jgi:hypothetical protein
VAITLSAAVAARADTLSWSMSGVTTVSMGQDPNWNDGTQYDQLLINPGAGTISSFSSSVAGGLDVAINAYDFIVGYNRWNAAWVAGAAPIERDLTLTYTPDNALAPATVVAPISMSQDWDINISYADTLHLWASAPVFINLGPAKTVEITLLETTIGPNGGGTQSGSLMAHFESVSSPFGDPPSDPTGVPLPAAVWPGMALLGGLGALRAWRRKAAMSNSFCFG